MFQTRELTEYGRDRNRHPPPSMPRPPDRHSTAPRSRNRRLGTCPRQMDVHANARTKMAAAIRVKLISSAPSSKNHSHCAGLRVPRENVSISRVQGGRYRMDTKLSTNLHLLWPDPERAEIWQNPATTPHKCRLEWKYWGRSGILQGSACAQRHTIYQPGPRDGTSAVPAHDHPVPRHG
jgi:hypothetical protein